MWLSETQNITKIYNVHGIKDFFNLDCYQVQIEEQMIIRQIEDHTEIFYNYYISDYSYNVKMFMYGTPTKCMPDEDQVQEYFNEYFENYINK